MIFNSAGKFIKNFFKVNGNPLEPVQTFCYLGFDLKASGTVKHAMNTLYDKANKAMHPLLNSIVRFNIPVKTSLNLFHAFISPIILYNTENWATLTNKKKYRILQLCLLIQIRMTQRRTYYTANF